MDRRLTAIVHARVSSSQQAEQELPIESQIAVASKKAIELGATVLKVFVENGVSGRLATRPELESAIAYCERNQVDYFITWASDRFARQHLYDGTCRARLRQVGTQIIDCVDYIAPGAEAWFWEGIRALMNEKKSRDIGRDTKRSLIKNAQDGRFNGGKVPIGYTVVQDGKRRQLVIHQEEAAVVRDIFAMYLRGEGLKNIATALNARGIKPRRRDWCKNSVSYLLQNKKYRGITIFNRTSLGDVRVLNPESEWVVVNSHEAIISEEDFMRVQSLMAGKAPAGCQGSPHSGQVFTGMLRCSHCDASMQTESATGRTKKYRYYNCSAFLTKGECRSRRINAEEFDAWLIEALVERLFSPERIQAIMEAIAVAAKEWATKREQERARMVAAIRAIEGRSKRLLDAVEDRGREGVEMSDIAPRLRENRKQLAKLEAELIDLEAEPDVQPLRMDLAEASTFLKDMVYTADTPVAKRQFFASFIREIRVDGQAVTVDFLPEKIVNQPGIRLVHSGDNWGPGLALLRTEKMTLELPPRLRRLAA